MQATELSNANANLAGSPLRALMLLVGAIGCGVLASVSWMLDKNETGFVLLDGKQVVAQVPTMVVLAILGMIAVGGVGLLMAFLKDVRLRTSIGWCFDWCIQHPKTGCIVIAVIAFGAFDLYEVMVDAEARRYNRDKPNESARLPPPCSSELPFSPVEVPQTEGPSALHSDEIDTLVARYNNGESTRQLATALGIDRKTVYATEQPGQPGLAAWDLINQTIAAYWKANNWDPVTDQDITEMVEDPDSPFEYVYEV